jgi:hypothetical protein
VFDLSDLQWRKKVEDIEYGKGRRMLGEWGVEGKGNVKEGGE